MAAIAADHSLLFGLLAVQNSLIDHVQLVAGFQAWTRDKARPLADGRLASAGGVDVELGDVKIWNLSTGRVLELRGHTGVVRGLACSPDGRRLATGSDDRTIKLWDTATGAEVFTVRGHTAGVIRVAPTAGASPRRAGTGLPGSGTRVLRRRTTGSDVGPSLLESPRNSRPTRSQVSFDGLGPAQPARHDSVFPWTQGYGRCQI
jgi:WD40 repeat protein